MIRTLHVSLAFLVLTGPHSRSGPKRPRRRLRTWRSAISRGCNRPAGACSARGSHPAPHTGGTHKSERSRDEVGGF